MTFKHLPHGYGSIPIDTFLVGWTSIYQLFWGSVGTRVLTHPHMLIHFAIFCHSSDLVRVFSMSESYGKILMWSMCSKFSRERIVKVLANEPGFETWLRKTRKNWYGCVWKWGIHPNSYFNGEYDYQPLDFGVPYFQTNPYTYIYIYYNVYTHS